MPAIQFVSSITRALFAAAILCTGFAGTAAAQEDKGPVPLRLLNSQSLSADEIVEWVNMRRDVTVHIFAIEGDKFRELDRFSATYESCKTYINAPADLTYDSGKNFYGYLSDKFIGKKVRIVCTENINKFSLQEGVDKLNQSITRLQGTLKGGGNRSLNTRLDTLSKELDKQSRDIRSQSIQLSKMSRDIDRIERFVRRINRR